MHQSKFLEMYVCASSGSHVGYAVETAKYVESAASTYDVATVGAVKQVVSKTPAAWHGGVQ